MVDDTYSSHTPWASWEGLTAIRTRIKLTRDGEAFRGRLTATQTDLMCEALSSLDGWASTDEALVVQLGADREEVGRLYDRLAGAHRTTREFTLTARIGVSQPQGAPPNG